MLQRAKVALAEKVEVCVCVCVRAVNLMRAMLQCSLEQARVDI
jgi:hypothetical protein